MGKTLLFFRHSFYPPDFISEVIFLILSPPKDDKNIIYDSYWPYGIINVLVKNGQNYSAVHIFSRLAKKTGVTRFFYVYASNLSFLLLDDKYYLKKLKAQN